MVIDQNWQATQGSWAADCGEGGLTGAPSLSLTVH